MWYGLDHIVEEKTATELRAADSFVDPSYPSSREEARRLHRRSQFQTLPQLEDQCLLITERALDREGSQNRGNTMRP